MNWGGEPTKAIDASGRLRPRHSFAMWKEEVRFRSRPWTPNDVDAADELQRRVVEADIERRLAAEQRAVRARDEVVAIVSHDLKNPLHIVALQASTLSRAIGTADDEGSRALRDGLERIGKSVSRMKALINDLLDLSRIEAGSFRLERRPVESGEMLAGAIADAQPLADAKRISLVAEVVAPPKLEADRGRVSQLLANLLGNAIKFTPEGGTVKLHAEPRDGALSVTITDSGPGIAPEDLPHVFERYWKSAHGEGTGLGLYIASGVVKAHGGRIWAESSARGASFTFTLPLSP